MGAAAEGDNGKPELKGGRGGGGGGEEDLTTKKV
jgi:hypothetical protein